MQAVMKRRMLFSVNKVFLSNDKGNNLDRLPYIILQLKWKVYDKINAVF
jgi:hypothetical protein